MKPGAWDGCAGMAQGLVRKLCATLASDPTMDQERGWVSGVGAGSPSQPSVEKRIDPCPRNKMKPRLRPGEGNMKAT